MHVNMSYTYIKFSGLKKLHLLYSCQKKKLMQVCKLNVLRYIDNTIL